MPRIGIASDALHLVIAAMVIAPGFEPMARIALGMAAHSSSWRRGARDTVKGYLALVAGAFAGGLIASLAGHSPLADPGGPLDPGSLASYWSSLTVLSALASAAAAVGGGVLIATNRTVLTAGAMIGLALVPSAALVGIGASAGQFDLAFQAVGRWALDVLLVVVSCWAVLAWKARRVHRRRSMLSP